MNQKEVWKDVKNYEGIYQVSNLGKVRSLDRMVNSSNNFKRFCKGSLLKNSFDKDGYCKVNLKSNSKGNSQRVHRLVAMSFICNPNDKPQVNHINGIKNDNRVENLEWCTLKENRQHAYDTGLQNGKSREGEKNNFNKLSKDEINEIRKLYIPYKMTNRMIAKKYNVTTGCIQSITSQRNRKWL